MSTIDLEVATKNERYLFTIKELRKKNFNKNLPFLILSDKLPDGQVYREYPDGRIELQEVFSIGSKYNYNLIRVLSAFEANKVLEENGLF
ncbi:MAG: hypothetical protein JWQ63_686 [Mucilaginibacter sp.]|nr:hypothetical protein [Mucilaginibacter sp.]